MRGVASSGPAGLWGPALRASRAAGTTSERVRPRRLRCPREAGSAAGGGRGVAGAWRVTAWGARRLSRSRRPQATAR
eukprot:14532343-Alexandrium_andersonii.AAC.1